MPTDVSGGTAFKTTPEVVSFSLMRTERHTAQPYIVRAQELCESRGERTGLPVPNGPYGLCGRKATLKKKPYVFRAQELCES